MNPAVNFLDKRLILTVTAVALVFFFIILAVLTHLIYPKLKQDYIISGTPQDGSSGNAGFDGLLGNFANDGVDGVDGVQGIGGLNGVFGQTGINGPNGNQGDTGFSGIPGEIGDQGLDSNSIVPILTRHDLSLTDSYTMTDTFSFNNQNYTVTLYANFENNSRFHLNSANTIELANGFNSYTYPGGTDPFTLENVAAGSFYSNVRIAVGYGKGGTNFLNRSDDTIFYVSPPISRKSFLFRYKYNGPIPDEFTRTDIEFPIKSLNNTHEFFYFPTVFDDTIAYNPENSIEKYHLIKGTGNYELVVNCFPPISEEYRFNYRIIEEYTPLKDSEFSLPRAIFPFNSTHLIYKDSDSLRTVTVSNRFDLDKVVERNFEYVDKIWIQTNKRNVELVTPPKDIRIAFQNTYSSLLSNLNTSITSLDNINYYLTGGETLLNTNDLSLRLFVDIVDDTNGDKFEGYSFYIGVRRYVSPVTTEYYKGGLKFYLQFKIKLEGYDEDALKHTVTYGEKYSLDLIDFKSVLSKTLFFPESMNLTPGLPGSLDYNSSGGRYQLDIFTPVKVGFTNNIDGIRYVYNIKFQNILLTKPYYYINIPLYGYKKE